MISLFKDEKGILCLHDMKYHNMNECLTIKFITMFVYIDIPRVREVEVRNKLFFFKKKKKKVLLSCRRIWWMFSAGAKVLQNRNIVVCCKGT